MSKKNNSDFGPISAKRLSDFMKARALKKFSNIPNRMLRRKYKKAGLLFGTTNVLGVRYYVGKKPDDDGNACVLGGSGSGKSSCISMHVSETWGNPIFAIDINRELSDYRLSKPGKRPFKILNLTDDPVDCAFCFDPFYRIEQSGERNLVADARELANSIIPIPYSEREPFWKESARLILAALLIHYYSRGDDFNTAIGKIQSLPLGAQIAGIVNDETSNEFAKALINQFAEFGDLSDSRMMLAIGTTLSNAIMTFATEEVVRNALTPMDDCIRWEDLETHDIFIRIDQSRLSQWGNVISMIVTQLIRALERRPNKYSANGSKHKPVLMLLDEFPAYGRMDVLANGLATLRGKNVTIALFAQSVAQFDLIYGANERKVIIDNSPYIAILKGNEADSQKYLAELIGYKNVATTSRTKNFDAKTGTFAGYSVNSGKEKEYIISPAELRKLEDIVLLTPEGTFRINKLPYYDRKEKRVGILSEIVQYVKGVVVKMIPWIKRVGGIALCLFLAKKLLGNTSAFSSLNASGNLVSAESVNLSENVKTAVALSLGDLL